MHLKVGSRVVVSTSWTYGSLTLPNPALATIIKIQRPRGGMKRYVLGSGMAEVKSVKYNPASLTELDRASIVVLLFQDVTKTGRLTLLYQEVYEQMTESGYSVSFSQIVGLAPNIFRTKPKTRTSKRGPLTIKTSKYTLSSHALT